ncbi:hypothetical protein Pcinc_030198 [Petrolisthes cinctipes]|uniref:Protein FAM92A n=1 Tax=Petrolisthes cinctipes TaxID=88211 RepID=A0AAE1EZC4_PETCI|nr:hypothetical protein Pcinc_030198 [Petrolisthes cinctipes]
MFSSSASSLNKVHSNQMKFIQDRISGVEKHFGEICTSLGAYTRKTAKLRDKGDDLSRVLQNYGEQENLNKSLRSAVCETADTIASVQDYRDVAVNRMESQVVEELGEYREVCRRARQELKHSFQTRQQEVSHRRSLEKTRTRNPHNRQQIILAETQLQKSTHEAQRACENLEQQMDTFEQRKVTDLKRIITEFIQTELAFHAKALELYTKAYNQMANVDMEEDLQAFRNARDVFDAEFRNALKGEGGLGRGEVVGAGLGSSLSPVITTARERKREKKRDLKQSVEKLQVEDYEEINTGSSTSSDSD